MHCNHHYPKNRNAAAEPRELALAERAAIKRLIIDTCANYDSEYGCLLLDSNCYMLGKWWAGNYCKYFQKAVLPTEPVLEAALLGGAMETRFCAVCNKPYIPGGKQVYCSMACKTEGNRRKSRERMRKKRRKI